MAEFLYCPTCKHRSPIGATLCGKCGFRFTPDKPTPPASMAATKPSLSTKTPALPLEAKGEVRDGIYRPTKETESEFLPGLPFWLLLYALALGITGLIWIVLIGLRFIRGEVAQFYGSDATGMAISVVLVLAGVYTALVALGIARLKRWGWRLGQITCGLWFAISLLLWLRGLSLIKPEDRLLFALVSVLGLSVFSAFDTILKFMIGFSPQDVVDFKYPSFLPRPRRIIIPATAAAVIVFGTLLYLIIPIVIALVSAVGIFVVVSLLMLEPGMWSHAGRLVSSVLAIILVGGALDHLLMIELLRSERPRFN